MDKILGSIKQLLGIPENVTAFDTEIIIAVNSALMTLNQLGIGPDSGFVITGVNDTWAQLLGTATNLEAAKTFVYLKTKLVFDPPITAHLVEAINRQINELEWRLVAQKEHVEESEEPIDE